MSFCNLAKSWGNELIVHMVVEKSWVVCSLVARNAFCQRKHKMTIWKYIFLPTLLYGSEELGMSREMQSKWNVLE